MPKLIADYGPVYQHGRLSIENIDQINDMRLDQPLEFGVQVADDGRVWVCLNGVSWLRFKPIQSG